MVTLASPKNTYTDKWPIYYWWYCSVINGLCFSFFLYTHIPFLRLITKGPDKTVLNVNNLYKQVHLIDNNPKIWIKIQSARLIIIALRKARKIHFNLITFHIGRHFSFFFFYWSYQYESVRKNCVRWSRGVCEIAIKMENSFNWMAFFILEIISGWMCDWLIDDWWNYGFIQSHPLDVFPNETQCKSFATEEKKKQIKNNMRTNIANVNVKELALSFRFVNRF